MDEKNYKITLADGTELSNLTMNGNNFISEATIDPGIFQSNCSPVVISDGEHDETHENMELVQVTEVNGQSWFVLRDMTPKELEQAKIKSDIEYLAMMCDVDL
ncbi:hypothetical protein HLY09_26560 [Enterocloster bolteae]|jgi:hypothetical protein|uniref:hypothetical protein n=2 Tax=cellular organisms TaxID=131567 RepID=UPI00148B6FB6|nr:MULTISPECIES: hypothetical protein [Bacteria]QJU22476.1 hypothetical protein HLY09_25395 [Enterocloster bolteae]QJU22687.1 hypothetical protein HLY09_26560 [Enterocloster bolteae]